MFEVNNLVSIFLFSTSDSTMEEQITFDLKSQGNVSGAIYIKKNGQEVLAGSKRGLNVAVFNADTGDTMLTDTFDTDGNESESNRFASTIHNVITGSIVAIAVCDDAAARLSEEAKQACRMLGSCRVHSLRFRGAWALVGIKGAAPGLADEKLENPHNAGDSVSVELTSTLPLRPADKKTIIISAMSAGYYSGSDANVSVDGQAVSIPGGYGRGLNVIVLDESNGKVLETRVYDTDGSESESEKFASFIDGLPYGRIVAIACKDDAAAQLTKSARAACASLGSSLIDTLGFRDAWAIIGIKGASIGSVAEAHSSKKAVQCLSWMPTEPIYTDSVSILSQSNGYDKGGQVQLSIDGIHAADKYTRGITLAVVETSTGILEKLETFDTDDINQEAYKDLVNMIDTTTTGKMVIATVSDDGAANLPSEARMALEQIGSSLIQKLAFRDSWAIIGRKGCAPGAVPEILSSTGPLAVQFCASLATSALARPYFCLRALSAGHDVGNTANISVDHQPLIQQEKLGRGLNVVVLEGQFYQVLATDCFDTDGDESESARFVKLVEKQQNGSVIAIAVFDDAAARLTTEAKQTIQSLGSTKIQQLCFRDSWSMVAIKGYQGEIQESLSTSSQAHCTFCLPANGVQPLSSGGQTLLKALSSGKESSKISSITLTNASGSTEIAGGTTSGLTAVELDQNSLEVLGKRQFDTGSSSSASDNLAEFIESIPTGHIVIVAACGNVATHLSERAKLALESIGSAHIRHVQENYSWAINGIKGAAPGSVCECRVGLAQDAIGMFLQESPTSRHGGRQPRALFILTGLLAGAIISGLVSIATGFYYTSNYGSQPAVCYKQVEPLPTQCGPSQRKALFVGINYGRGQSTALKKLPLAYARQMKRAMVMAKLFPANECAVLVDEVGDNHEKPPNPEEWASKENIQKKLQSYVADAKEGDVYLFFYCGHGSSNKNPPVNPNDKTRQEYLTTLSSDLNRKELLSDVELNEITHAISGRANLTFLFHACFSGGMFDKYPPLPYPMKGIALTSVDGTIPAIIQSGAQVEDVDNLTTVIRNKVKAMKNSGQTPTYAQVYDEVKAKTSEYGKVIHLPNDQTITVDYVPQIYVDPNYCDPNKQEFLQPLA